MILGTVDDGTPVIILFLAGRSWPAIIDTGFNGDMELPIALKSSFNTKYMGETTFILAAGQTVIEDSYLLDFPFDGETVEAEATFVPGDDILIGTGLLSRHRLEINFPARTVLIERAV